MIYDMIIIGAGPAGLTAAIYAARKRISLLVITLDIGGQAAWSGDVENYTGYQFITGPELSAKFEDHMRTYNISVKENEEAEDVQREGSIIKVKTHKGEYESKALIIASGKISRELNVPGEKEYKHKGVTYCATCDGPLFSGKDVAIIGGGNSALDASLQMMRIAKHVYVINSGSTLGGDAVMREKVEKSHLVTILNSAKVIEITGDKMVSGIKVMHEEKERLIPVIGIFIEIGLIPNSKFAASLNKNKYGEIEVSGSNETNIPGIFAAGDVTNVAEKQIVIAAGEGSKAALSAFKYLNKIK